MAALLWHQHGAHMPLAACESWAASVTAAVASLPRVKQLGGSWRLWTLRFLQEVAAQFPADQSQQHADGRWTKAWQASVQCMQCKMI